MKINFKIKAGTVAKNRAAFGLRAGGTMKKYSNLAGVLLVIGISAAHAVGANGRVCQGRCHRPGWQADRGRYRSDLRCSDGKEVSAKD